MIAHQSSGKKRPSATWKPCGVCIQLFTDRIQNVENSVPAATIRPEKKCSHAGTSLRPNRSTPRNEASRKNAVSPSYARSGASTLAVVSENRLQLVPIWNGMTMPDTTPIPNDTAKMRVQNAEMRTHMVRPVKKASPSSTAM